MLRKSMLTGNSVLCDIFVNMDILKSVALFFLTITAILSKNIIDKRFLSNVNKIASSYLHVMFPDNDNSIVFMDFDDGNEHVPLSFRKRQLTDKDIYFNYYEDVLQKMYKKKKKRDESPRGEGLFM